MQAMLAWLLLLLASCCQAAGVCPDVEQGQWASACFTHTAQGRQIKPVYRRNIRFDASGHAVMRIAETFEMVAVDRRGVVVVPGIYYLTDFDYPAPRDHLARFVDQGKCGYFDVRNFKITIPAIYDQCMSFRSGVGSTCKDCELYCTDPECHHSVFVDGNGFELDAANQVVRQFVLPPLARACPGRQSGTLEPQGGDRAWLKCPDNLNSPFKMN